MAGLKKQEIRVHVEFMRETGNGGLERVRAGMRRRSPTDATRIMPRNTLWFRFTGTGSTDCGEGAGRLNGKPDRYFVDGMVRTLAQLRREGGRSKMLIEGLESLQADPGKGRVPRFVETRRGYFSVMGKNDAVVAARRPK